MRPYDKEKYLSIYQDLVYKNRFPAIVSEKELYIISIDAVGELQFFDDGISFSATFKGVKRLVSLYKDDIEDIIDFDPEEL